VLGQGCSRVIGVRVKGVRIRAVVVRVRLLRTELVLQLEFWVRVEHEADARDGDFRGGGRCSGGKCHTIDRPSLTNWPAISYDSVA